MLAPACMTETLDWFEPFFRSESGWRTPVVLVEALFPEKLYRLNRQKLSDSGIELRELCR